MGLISYSQSLLYLIKILLLYKHHLYGKHIQLDVLLPPDYLKKKGGKEII